MAKVAKNTSWVVTVYDLEGNPSVCSLIDAKERVQTGRWTYSPPAAEVKAEMIEEPEAAEVKPQVEPNPKPKPAKEVKKDGTGNGGRKRKK